MQADSTKPKARTEELVVQAQGDETLIYDLRSHHAHCLNPLASLVWSHCDGRRTMAELATLAHQQLGTPDDGRIVEVALQELEQAKLLDGHQSARTSGKVSRRELVRAFGSGSAAFLVAPLVVSIQTQSAMAAASPRPTTPARTTTARTSTTTATTTARTSTTPSTTPTTTTSTPTTPNTTTTTSTPTTPNTTTTTSTSTTPNTTTTTTTTTTTSTTTTTTTTTSTTTTSTTTTLAPSDRNLKQGFTEVDVKEVLRCLAGVRVQGWSYKDDPAVRHIGPMAQDFFATFGLGDDRHIHAVDAAGISFAAVQALYWMLRENGQQIAELSDELDELQPRLARGNPALAAGPNRQPSGMALIPATVARNEENPIELTIGMAAYHDFDGVYFSVQDLRLHHDMENVEILVVDNFGCAQTEEFVKSCHDPRVRYLLYKDKTGTAAPRQKVFEEARGKAVVCMDSHVLFAPGAIARLKQFYRDHPDTLDLYQGPLLWDDMNISTHFKPTWGANMYGQWDTDPRGRGDEPFPIPMQGLGSFTCRKEAWLGFNPNFRGFGGEEFYIHEKFRRAGRQCWCLPWLLWLHRFGRPQGAPYANTLEDRMTNYLVGWSELGLPLNSIYENFLQSMPPEHVAELASAALGTKVTISPSLSIKEEAKPREILLPMAQLCKAQ